MHAVIPLPDDFLRPADNVTPINQKYTDSGNAELLVNLYRGRLHFSPERNKWLLWDGMRWRWCERGEPELVTKYVARKIASYTANAKDDKERNAILAHARDSESAAARANMLKLARHEKGISRQVAELDRDPMLFNVLNGTLDLRTGSLRPHTQADMITKLAPVVFEPGAYSELWEQCLVQWTGGDTELSEYLKRVVGYCLTGCVTEKAFFFLYGIPDGMKSSFIRAISTMMGDYAAAASFSTWLVQTASGGNRPDLVELKGVRFVASVEVRPGAKFDEEILKKWTGGDAVTAAAKFENPITFQPQGKLFMAANDSPSVRDGDAGALLRMRRIPFNNALPKELQDKSMSERLAAPEVKAAILAWALEGCLEWQGKGRAPGLGSCKAVDTSTAEYAREIDMTADFFEECCVFEPGAKVASSELRSKYMGWCQDSGIRFPLTPKAMAKKLHAKGCVISRTMSQRLWMNVKLV